jgi:hypothetical protein
MTVSPAVVDIVQAFSDDLLLAGKIGVSGDDGDGLLESLEGWGD